MSQEPELQESSPEAPWQELGQIVEEKDPRRLRDFAETMGLRDATRALSRLAPAQQQEVMAMMPAEDAAELVEEMPEAKAVELLEQLPADQAAEIFASVDSDERADLISLIQPAAADAILDAMDSQQADDVRRLSAYPGNVAGGLMITEYLCFRMGLTVGAVLEDLRFNAERYTKYSVQYSYVVDDAGRLVGVLPLRDLVLTIPTVPLRRVMIEDPLSVADYAPLDELAEFFDKHDFMAAPVVDDQHRLVGVVQSADIEEALGEEADSNFLKAYGIVGGDELRSMPTAKRSVRRLSWLSVNIVLNIIAASIIAQYEATLQAVIALAVFLPIISDMSGCSGNQAVAVSMRELTMGLIKPVDVLYVWLKEIKVGLLNGLALGMLIGAVAWVWKGNPFLGAVVGAALAINTMVAVSIGGVVPLVLKRFNLDPAMASGPILTTITDMCGFFFVLSLATVMLDRLV